ncbi:tail fiber assembly protein [Paraburkholderia sp. BR14374]|uniref:tail fiber assembly protein n=1 Tax=Paraburkholderia sp. BR14374 TaxID=3237007 RepID=UPI0034CF4B2E
MLTHDQLIFVIRNEIPGVEHGKDFLVGHPLDDDGNQCGPAFMVQWKRTDIPVPNVALMTDLYPKYEKDFQAAQVRERRDWTIAKSDWTQNPDIPEATRQKWQAYRQALRDITAQEGFPLSVEWPVEPQ